MQKSEIGECIKTIAAIWTLHDLIIGTIQQPESGIEILGLYILVRFVVFYMALLLIAT